MALLHQAAGFAAKGATLATATIHFGQATHGSLYAGSQNTTCATSCLLALDDCWRAVILKVTLSQHLWAAATQSPSMPIQSWQHGD